MTPFRILVKRPMERRPVRAWVVKQRGSFFEYVEDAPGRPPETTSFHGDVHSANEGITWCREWTGPGAEAFKVSVALT